MSAPPPSPGFLLFTLWIRLPPALTMRFHEALVACGERQARSFLHALERMGTRRTVAGRKRFMRRYWSGVGSPHGLVTLIETLTERGLLTRTEATCIQEGILTWTRHDGAWALS